MNTLDHILIGTCSLEAGARWANNATGIRPVHGGRHLNQGTENVLSGLGPGTYLEIIGPDHASDIVSDIRNDLAALQTPSLYWWACRCDDLDAVADRLSANGHSSALIEDGSRKTDENILLSWRLLFPPATANGRLVPFLIDWQNTQHPSVSLSSLGTVKHIKLFTPFVSELETMLDILGAGQLVTIAHSKTLGVEMTIALSSGREWSITSQSLSI